MNSVLLIQITLLVISLTLSVIFAMAWQTMGRKKYTLIWAFTFLVITVQRLFNLARSEFDSYELYWMIVCTFSVMSVLLGTWGHMLRTRHPFPIKYLAYAMIATLVLTFYFTIVAPHVGLRMSIYIFFNATLLFFVGIIIYRFRPKPLPAEIGASVSYILLGLFQVGAAIFALLQGAQPDPTFREVYTFLNLVSLPAAFVGMGLFVVFMLASDLSEEMKVLAMTDSLTSSLNRRGFYARAQQKIDLALEKSQHVCLIYWDIDKFKSINDKYGHGGGDKVLIDTVERVKQNIKKDDLLGRLGGEEFVILLGRAELADAKSVAERIRTAIEQTPVDFNQQSIEVTASFGVVFINQGNMQVENAIDHADRALYQAKQEGRNQVVVAV